MHKRKVGSLILLIFYRRWGLAVQFSESNHMYCFSTVNRNLAPSLSVRQQPSWILSKGYCIVAPIYADQNRAFWIGLSKYLIYYKRTFFVLFFLNLKITVKINQISYYVMNSSGFTVEARTFIPHWRGTEPEKFWRQNQQRRWPGEIADVHYLTTVLLWYLLYNHYTKLKLNYHLKFIQKSELTGEKSVHCSVHMSFYPNLFCAN